MGARYSLRFRYVDCIILLLCVVVLNRLQIHIAQVTGFTPDLRLGFMLLFLVFNVQYLWVVFVHVFLPFTIVLSFGIDLWLLITSCYILISLTPLTLGYEKSLWAVALTKDTFISLTFLMKISSFHYYQDTKHYSAMHVNFIICLNRLSVLVILISNE